MSIVPKDLKALYDAGRVIPFIGAGASMSVEWTDSTGKPLRGPTWSGLVDQAARILEFTEPNLLRVRGTDLQILEYFRLKKSGFAPLTNWLYASMQPPESALEHSSIHRALARLERCNRFYTTNYDDFLERSLRVHGRACNVVAIESDLSVDSKCEVVKFHGDFNHPERMVLSESDYERRLSFGTPLDLKFRSDMLGRVVLFLGYSFRDANVSYLFHLVKEQLESLPGSPSGRRAYIIVSDPSEFEYTLFRARNIDVIPVRQRCITADTADFLNELVT